MYSVIVVVTVLLICGCGLLWCKELAFHDGSGKIKFKFPELNEEEGHGQHMPSHLTCDACKVLAYQFFLKFSKLQKKVPSRKKLLESDTVAGVEEVCSDKFENIGIKEVNKVKRLSGPGLETSETPGILMGGGMLPERLKSMCYQYVEEYGDEVIYEEFLNHKNLDQLFCKSNRKPGLTDACLSEHEKTKQTTEQKKKRNKNAEAYTKEGQMNDEL